LVNFGPLTTKL